MSTSLFSHPPSLDEMNPHLRQLGVWLLAFANAQERRLPSATDSDYLENCHICPACGASQVEGDSISIEEGLAFQPVSCLSCNASWRDVYVLSGFDQLIIDAPSATGNTPVGLDRVDD